MSPRPRTVSDEDVLLAAARTIARVGPGKLTLADVADEAGLAPATLLQRFGSKRGLLLAVAESGALAVDGSLAAVRAEHASPLAALVAAVLESTQYIETPEALVNGLAFLQIDLADPEFHQYALENSVRVRSGYLGLLEEAVAAGELVPCNCAAWASAVQAVAAGSLLNWAIHREGALTDWLRRDVQTVMAPLLRSRPS